MKRSASASSKVSCLRPVPLALPVTLRARAGEAGPFEGSEIVLDYPQPTEIEIDSSESLNVRVGGTSAWTERLN